MKHHRAHPRSADHQKQHSLLRNSQSLFLLTRQSQVSTRPLASIPGMATVTVTVTEEVTDLSGQESTTVSGGAGGGPSEEGTKALRKTVSLK